jgi:type II secretory pathway component PulM
MINLSTASAAKKSRLSAFKQFPFRAIILAVACLVIGILWLLIIQPLQKSLELRLQRYPMQLMSIQDLNQTLVRYKDKDVRISRLSEIEFSRLEQKLFSQGIKYTLRRIENISPAQLELKIDDIEFSRWLELVADFRQTYGLYVVGASIKKNDGVGVVRLSATLAQAR